MNTLVFNMAEKYSNDDNLNFFETQRGKEGKICLNLNGGGSYGRFMFLSKKT